MAPRSSLGEVRTAGSAEDVDRSPGTTGASGAALGARRLARQQHQLGLLGSKGWTAGGLEAQRRNHRNVQEREVPTLEMAYFCGCPVNPTSFTPSQSLGCLPGRA